MAVFLSWVDYSAADRGTGNVFNHTGWAQHAVGEAPSRRVAKFKGELERHPFSASHAAGSSRRRRVAPDERPDGVHRERRLLTVDHRVAVGAERDEVRAGIYLVPGAHTG